MTALFTTGIILFVFIMILNFIVNSISQGAIKGKE